MSLAKLSSKSQIVLPASIRRDLGLKAGDLLQVETEGDRVVVRKAPASFVDALAECSSDLWKGFEAELEKDREEWGR